MASRAEKLRLKKARLIQAADDKRAGVPAVQPGAAARIVETSSTRRAHEPRDDGLDQLRSKGRVTARQVKAGREYGMLFRTASIESGASIKGVDLNAVRGGSSDRAIGSDLLNAEWIAESRARLLKARSALFHHAEMIAVVDLICGQGMRPREISQIQRHTEQIETALRLALDVLAKHFQEEDFHSGDAAQAA